MKTIKHYIIVLNIFLTYHINKIINNDYIPILSEYGGNDEKIGIAHFKYLREIQEKNNNFTTDIVYMKYANHSLINYDTENEIKAMREIHTKILKYSNLYFKDENYDIENMNKFLDNGGRIESWHFLYGYKLENLSYVKNGIINNTYKLGGINYNEEIGNVYNRKDYAGNENNKYDLFIPIKAINKKNDYNGLIIFLHGGGRFKEDMQYFCSRYAKAGYITATMHYNEVKNNDNITSLFSMLDEIRACVTDIKQKFKDEYGFDETKLEMAIGRHSLGGHLSMLYVYSTKNNSPIPVKFILNQAGTLDNRTYYDYSLAQGKEPLTDIEPESIKEGVNNGTLVPIFNDQNFLIW